MGRSARNAESRNQGITKWHFVWNYESTELRNYGETEIRNYDLLPKRGWMLTKNSRMREFLKGVWQFCSYLFVPQRRPKDEGMHIEDWTLKILAPLRYASVTLRDAEWRVEKWGKEEKWLKIWGIREKDVTLQWDI